MFISISTFSKELTRLISTSPAITEILFKLGAGDKVKAVTPYCFHPEVATKLPKIGTAFSINFESLLKQNPGLVLLSKTKGLSNEKELKKLKINYKLIKHDTLDDVLNSILDIGNYIGKKSEALILHRALVEKINSYKRIDDSRRVMIVIDAQVTAGKIKTLYLAGNQTFYQGILDRMGMKNVIANSSTAYPIISGERIFKYNPDIILFVKPANTDVKALEIIKNAWNKYKMIKAVKNKEIYFFTGDEFIIPGPRIVQAMAAFHKAFERGDNVKSK
jgi:iron complex transport system substrate-binding protein